MLTTQTDPSFIIVPVNRSSRAASHLFYRRKAIRNMLKCKDAIAVPAPFVVVGILDVVVSTVVGALDVLASAVVGVFDVLVSAVVGALDECWTIVKLETFTIVHPPGMDDCETLRLFNTFTFTIVQHSFGRLSFSRC